MGKLIALIQIPEWRLLGKVGSNKLVRLTPLIPLIGYFILFNSEVVRILELSAQIFPQMTLSLEKEEPSTFAVFRLFCIYFGFSFLAIGSMIYALRCPPLVDDYKSDGAFLESQIPLLSPNRATKLVAELRSCGSKIEANMAEFYEQRMIGPESVEELSSEKIDILQLYWNFLNHKNKNTRAVVYANYIAGFVFLAIPTIHMFFQVVGEATKRILSL